MRSFLVVIALAACGDEPLVDAPDAPSPDATAIADAPPVPDAQVDGELPALGCLGKPPVAVADDPMDQAGRVFEIVDYQIAALPGAAVELRDRATGDPIGASTTDASGDFAMTIATGGAPVDAYFSITAGDRLRTDAYPADPLVGGENVLLVVAAEAEVAAWYGDAGATFAPGARTMIAVVVDCDADSIAGSTIAVTPKPTDDVVYYDDVAQRWDPALAASTNGFALLPNAVASSTITAATGASVFPAAVVPAASGTLTLAVISPTD